MPPNPVCQEGLAYPAREPLTTPEVEGDPVAQPLGPPDPPTRAMYWPFTAVELGNGLRLNYGVSLHTRPLPPSVATNDEPEVLAGGRLVVVVLY